VKNIASITALLAMPLLTVSAFGGNTSLAGNIGLALVFAFTALGHFVKTEHLARMLPPSLPKRRALILVSGLFEAALAGAIVLFQRSLPVGIITIGFLILVFPCNIYAAIRRVDFGGHSAGPSYLLVRTPLQLLLILWTYWFMLRPP
jgi:uncharacterized membrane protein